MLKFDQPSWLKEAKIIQEKPFSIVCRLGDFHTPLSYLGSISAMMKGSALVEPFETVNKEPTFCQILQEKLFHVLDVVNFLTETVLVMKLLRHLFPAFIFKDFQGPEDLLMRNKTRRRACEIFHLTKMTIYQIASLSKVLHMTISLKKQIYSK